MFVEPSSTEETLPLLPLHRLLLPDLSPFSALSMSTPTTYCLKQQGSRRSRTAMTLFRFGGGAAGLLGIALVFLGGSSTQAGMWHLSMKYCVGSCSLMPDNIHTAVGGVIREYRQVDCDLPVPTTARYAWRFHISSRWIFYSVDRVSYSFPPLIPAVCASCSVAAHLCVVSNECFMDGRCDGGDGSM